MPMPECLYILDDESDIRVLVSGILEDEGYEARSFATVRTFLAAIRDQVPELVLLDIWLDAQTDGIRVLEQLKQDHPFVPVIMMSGHSNIETAVKAIHLGAYDFLEKPFNSERLVTLVRRAIETAALRRENLILKHDKGERIDLHARSTVMQQLLALLEKVSLGNSRLFFFGPPGSGKSTLARHAHQVSKRSDFPLIEMPTASMKAPEQLEALFGREEKGKVLRRGFLEEANQGALLIKEVTCLSEDVQTRLARFLSEGRFYRDGGKVTQRPDVRIMATSDRDLRQLVDEGRFNSDLFHRLVVTPFQVPGLKERQADIVDILQGSLQKALTDKGLTPKPLSEGASSLISAYPWPGNLRELNNLVEWLVIRLTNKPDVEEITADLLPPEIADPSQTKLAGDGESIYALPLREAREQFERNYLAAQLLRFSGNVTRTAAFVGMDRSAFHRKIRSLGLG